MISRPPWSSPVSALWPPTRSVLLAALETEPAHSPTPRRRRRGRGLIALPVEWLLTNRRVRLRPLVMGRWKLDGLTLHVAKQGCRRSAQLVLAMTTHACPCG